MCAKVGKSLPHKRMASCVIEVPLYESLGNTSNTPTTKTRSINWIYANGSINITVASFQQQLITTTYNVTVFMVDSNLCFFVLGRPKTRTL